MFFFTTDTTMYSFSVRLHENTLLTDAPCIFGTVDLNIGDGYDEFSGEKFWSIPSLIIELEMGSTWYTPFSEAYYVNHIEKVVFMTNNNW